MKLVNGIVKEFGKIVEEAEDSVLAQVQLGDIPSETSITDRFLESIRMRVERSEFLSAKGVSVRVRSLSDRGPKPEEFVYGADFAVILNIDMSNYKLKKGFFCQAKMERTDFTVSNFPRITKVSFNTQSGLDKLKIQTEKMLKVSPDSFVVIYGTDSFLMVPAISVDSLISPDTLYAKKMKDFFKEFLMCFIGDRNITPYAPDWENALRVRKVLEIEIISKEELVDKKDPNKKSNSKKSSRKQ